MSNLPEGLDLELLAYDISDMLPLDVCEADILPALGDFLRAITQNAQEVEDV